MAAMHHEADNVQSAVQFSLDDSLELEATPIEDTFEGPSAMGTVLFDNDEVELRMTTMTLTMLMTPPPSPSKKDREAASSSRSKCSRHSLSDWWGGADCEEQDEDAEADNEDTEHDEDVRSTTASEAGEPPASPTRSRSPTKRRSTRDRQAKAKFLPKIFYVGDDWDELAAGWAPSPSKQASRAQTTIDSTDVEIDLQEDETVDVARKSKGRRQSTGDWFMGLAEVLGEHMEEIYEEQYAITIDTTSECMEVADATYIEQIVGFIAGPRYYFTEVVDLDEVRTHLFPNIANPLYHTIPEVVPNLYPSFESGHHLKVMTRVDVVVLALKGKKRGAAKSPEDFARTLQTLVTKTQGREGNDQQQIIETSQLYTKVFRKAMGLAENPEDEPALGVVGELLTDVKLGAVAELLDDVRTGAWNMAAFVFRR